MKTYSTIDNCLEPPEGGVFGDLQQLMTAEASSEQPRRTNEQPLPSWPAMGASSFADLDPWQRGGLNE